MPETEQKQSFIKKRMESLNISIIPETQSSIEDFPAGIYKMPATGMPDYFYKLLHLCSNVIYQFDYPDPIVISYIAGILSTKKDELGFSAAVFLSPISENDTEALDFLNFLGESIPVFYTAADESTKELETSSDDLSDMTDVNITADSTSQMTKQQSTEEVKSESDVIIPTTNSQEQIQQHPISTQEPSTMQDQAPTQDNVSQSINQSETSEPVEPAKPVAPAAPAAPVEIPHTPIDQRATKAYSNGLVVPTYYYADEIFIDVTTKQLNPIFQVYQPLGCDTIYYLNTTTKCYYYLKDTTQTEIYQLLE